MGHCWWYRLRALPAESAGISWPATAGMGDAGQRPEAGYRQERVTLAA